MLCRKIEQGCLKTNVLKLQIAHLQSHDVTDWFVVNESVYRYSLDKPRRSMDARIQYMW